ncbi:unnamed protein product [Ceutorhynchus assimilis]|uniref:Protein kinase domain-containing protein n=1 Tax=Ceutorhynchus assimilis TaxID=467358 RepID=A0A9P0DHY3_9CUCU|nr:unnamed protein product [Ceutorhynchus assimilis]
MEISWKWLNLYLGLLLVGLCKGFPLNLEENSAGHTQFLTCVAAILITVGSIVLVGCLCCQRRKGFEEFHNSPVVATVASNLDHGHINPISNGEFTIFTPLSPPHFNNNVFLANEQVIRTSTDDYVYGDINVSLWFDGPEKDFPRSKLKYIREIGKGAFGKIVEGAAQDLDSSKTWTPVTVRILDAAANQKERILFLNDALFYLAPPHPNLLKLKGRCLSAAPLLVLQETCGGGDLKQRLRSFGSEDKILQWCCQLTSGLKHLHDNGFIHPDLAARNCLLTESLNLKIGDYNLGPHKYSEDYYRGGEPPIPVRWRSPESLDCTPTTIQPRKLTKEANVWSLAVVMWEICENGAQPYGSLNDDDVISRVFGVECFRLDGPSKPQMYSDYIFRLIKMCWNNAESRPKVDQIDIMLSDLYQVHKNTHSEPLNATEDFDSRWKASKPNTIVKTDNHSVSIDIDSVEDLKLIVPSPKPINFKLGPSFLSANDDSLAQADSLTDSMIYKQQISSESDTEEENWRRKVERGAYSEKVRLKSRSVADLMVLTHVDYSESESETPMPSLDYKLNNRSLKKSNLENSNLNFSSEGNLFSLEDNFEKELKKLQVERRDSLLFVPDGNKSQNNSNLSLLRELNSPTEIKPMNQIYNIFNVSIESTKIDSEDTRLFSRQDSENKSDLGYATLHNSERNSDFGSVDGEQLLDDKTVIIEERLKNSKQNLPDILASLEEHSRGNIDLLEPNLSQQNLSDDDETISDSRRESTLVQESKNQDLIFSDKNHESQIVPEFSDSNNAFLDENEAKTEFFVDNLLPEIKQSFIKGPNILESRNCTSNKQNLMEVAPNVELNAFLNAERSNALPKIPQTYEANFVDDNEHLNETNIFTDLKNAETDKEPVISVDIEEVEENQVSTIPENDKPQVCIETEKEGLLNGVREVEETDTKTEQDLSANEDLISVKIEAEKECAKTKEEVEHISKSNSSNAGRVVAEEEISSTKDSINEKIAETDNENSPDNSEVEKICFFAFVEKPSLIDESIAETKISVETKDLQDESFSNNADLSYNEVENKEEASSSDGKPSEKIFGKTLVDASVSLSNSGATKEEHSINKLERIPVETIEEAENKNSPSISENEKINILLLSEEKDLPVDAKIAVDTENMQNNSVLTDNETEIKEEVSSSNEEPEAKAEIEESVASSNSEIDEVSEKPLKDESLINEELAVNTVATSEFNSEIENVKISLPPEEKTFLNDAEEAKTSAEIEDVQAKLVPSKTDSTNNEVDCQEQASSFNEKLFSQTETVKEEGDFSTNPEVDKMNILLPPEENTFLIDAEKAKIVVEIEDLQYKSVSSKTGSTNNEIDCQENASSCNEKLEKIFLQTETVKEEGDFPTNPAVDKMNLLLPPEENTFLIDAGEAKIWVEIENLQDKSVSSNTGSANNEEEIKACNLQHTESIETEKNTPPKVTFDLSTNQQEIMPNSLTHNTVFTSTPFGKKPELSLPPENAYSSLNLFKSENDENDEMFSSQFMPLDQCELTEDNEASKLNYSLETWDNFLGKSFDSSRDNNENMFDSFTSEPQSMLFLEGDQKLNDKNETFNLQDGTFVLEDKKDGTFVKEDKKDGTFVIEDKKDGTFVMEKGEENAEENQASGQWESSGGWFLHPQSSNDKLSGDIVPQPSTSKGSYIGFGMDDEIMTAIRNELLEKLPHAQGASSQESVKEEEEWNQTERNEVFLRYNVYNTPLSPIPEECSFDVENGDEMVDTSENTPKYNESDSDWSDQDDLEPPPLSSQTIDSPQKMPSKGHTASQSSCCSNDTLFNFDDFAPNNEKEIHEPSETYDVFVEEIKELSQSDKNSIVKDTDDKTESEFHTCSDNYEEVTDTIIPDIDNDKNSGNVPSPDLCTDKLSLDEFLISERNHTLSGCSSLPFSTKAIAPLPSPEDKPWKSLPASLLTYDKLQGPSLTIDNELMTSEITDKQVMAVLETISSDSSSSEGKQVGKETVTYENMLVDAGKDINCKESATYENVGIEESPTYEKILNNKDYENIPNQKTPLYENEDYVNIGNLDQTKDIFINDKEADYINTIDENTPGEDRDIFGVLTDIRFSGPIDSQLMSTSFSESNDVDEQDWDSGSDTRSSSSGEFIWKEGEHEESLKALRAAPQDMLEDVKPMEEIAEEITESDVTSGTSDEEGENLEFVPSAWDKFATPTKSALRSPEKSLDRSDSKQTRGVWFKKQKYHCVYEYPREPESPVLHSQDLWKPQMDYAAFSGASNNADEEDSMGSSHKRSTADTSIYSQFFPGAWIENATPDSGLEDTTPGSIGDASEFATGYPTSKEVLPLKKLAARAINKNKEISKGPTDVLGGLRHTRSKLKLDLPPSPSAFTSNKTFTVEPIQEPIIIREKPTFSTFGKSRFLVQQVDTPTDDLPQNKNVCFDVIPYKPMNLVPIPTVTLKTVQESVTYEPLKTNFDDISSVNKMFIKGEASLLDSADEDSGIESSTLERKLNNKEDVRLE